MQGKQIHGIYVGNPIEAQEKAAELSAKLNIRWKEKQFHTVLSKAPLMYRDLWTAGKCMYKLEPVVEEGGKLIIYAPHIKEISFTHGKFIRKIGYHPRDYFLKQWDKFKNYPGAILAHSTNIKGIGTYSDGVEKPRIEVVLATGIPRRVCEGVNLSYMDPKEINQEDYANREEEGILLVREAGEILYRLAAGSVPDIDKLYENL
jgi:nickel-dependent lactate racemase